MASHSNDNSFQFSEWYPRWSFCVQSIRIPTEPRSPIHHYGIHSSYLIEIIEHKRLIQLFQIESQEATIDNSSRAIAIICNRKNCWIYLSICSINQIRMHCAIFCYHCHCVSRSSLPEPAFKWNRDLQCDRSFTVIMSCVHWYEFPIITEQLWLFAHGVTVSDVMICHQPIDDWETFINNTKWRLKNDEEFFFNYLLLYSQYIVYHKSWNMLRDFDIATQLEIACRQLGNGLSEASIALYIAIIKCGGLNNTPN